MAITKRVEVAASQVTLKGKTSPFTRIKFTDLRKAIKQRFGAVVSNYGYGDEYHIFEKLDGLSMSDKQKGVTVKQAIADKGAAQDFLEAFEEHRLDSSDIEYLIELLIAANCAREGNYIVDIDDRDTGRY